MQRAPEGSFLGEVAEGVLGATGGGAGGQERVEPGPGTLGQGQVWER